MIVRAMASTIMGIDSYLVDVEVDVSLGLPAFNTVGLPDPAVKESRDRIKAAIKNSQYVFPHHHITVNLAPADVKKEGTRFDLPIALGILATQGVVAAELLSQFMVLGELSLDGAVKGVHGVLSAAYLAKEKGLTGMIVSHDNGPEAALVQGIKVITVEKLADVVRFLNGQLTIDPLVISIEDYFEKTRQDHLDYVDIRGQDQAKRALEVAAAGGHNLLMVGPPGSGKTMLAERLPSILPPLHFEEAIETTKIYSVSGQLDQQDVLIGIRPFRHPHQSISDAGMVGGGQIPKPGEVSLAHHGVLYLDEMPEFRRNTLESLRQPLESGMVVISRASMSVSFPAQFMLVASMNPCPCGYLGDPRRRCRCSVHQIQQYRQRISGPLLDRIDIHIDVPAVAYRDLTGKYEGERSPLIRDRVLQARKMQEQRFMESAIYCNARMGDQDMKKHCHLDRESQILCEMAMEKLGLSARAYKRILKVARTIADLAGQESIRSEYIAEAIQYRNLDRQGI